MVLCTVDTGLCRQQPGNSAITVEMLDNDVGLDHSWSDFSGELLFFIPKIIILTNVGSSCYKDTVLLTFKKMRWPCLL